MNTIQEYLRAAESGNRSAQEMLGLMYLYGSQLCGEGIARNMGEALRWLERAAEQGSMLARQLLRRQSQQTVRGPQTHMPQVAWTPREQCDDRNMATSGKGTTTTRV